MDFLDTLYKTNVNKRVTGQLFFRFVGPSVELDLSDRDMFAVVGNLAVPKRLVNDGDQITLAGYEIKPDEIRSGLDLKNVKNFKERFRGSSIGQVLLQPIWKI